MIYQNKNLSICIPTYNRKNELIRLLRSIENSQYKKLAEIVICDNNSNYDIVTELQYNFPSEFLEKCRIISNVINIGAPGNIKNTFLHCTSKYMWLIGDDDEILPDSIDLIYNDINRYPNCAFFKYSIKSKSFNGIEGHINEDDVDITNLLQLISYYKAGHNKGALFFMSNNIFNLELLSPYIHYATTYTTSITHMIPIFMGLDDNKTLCKYRSTPICLYHQPVEGGSSWNYVRIFLAVSTIPHIPFKSLNKDGLKDFMRILTMTPFSVFCYWVVCNKSRVQSFTLITTLYKTYYSYSRNMFHWIIYLLTYIEFTYDIKIWSSLYVKLLPCYRKYIKKRKNVNL